MSEIKIDAEAVQNAARLARIAICEQEAIELAKELDEVRVWIDQLQQVDVEAIAPLIHPNHQQTPTRADIAETPINREQALANSPQTADGHFVVPRVVG